MNDSKAESKRERFVRIAEARTNKILDMIRLLSNCSNINAYEYTSNDVDKIFLSIEKEIKDAKQKFLSKKGEDLKKFKL